MCKTVFTVVKSDDGVAAPRGYSKYIYYYITVLFFYIFNFAEDREGATRYCILYT